MSESFTEARFVTADGIGIQYRDYSAVGPEGGAPVLCLHGLTRNVRDFEELAPMIAGLGRRVIVASQRGRGSSDRDPVVERYNPATYVGDMLALLTQLGIDQAVFVGTSMGGLMTMIAAARAPQRLAGAVLNDVGPEFDARGIERIQGYVGKSTSVATWGEAAAASRAVHQVAFPKEEDEAFWLRFARRTFGEVAPGQIALEYDPGITRTVQPGSQALNDLWPFYEALRPIPALVIRGAISDILSEATVEEMRRRKPDLKVASVPDVGHAPFLTEPAAWAAVRAFITATG